MAVLVKFHIRAYREFGEIFGSCGIVDFHHCALEHGCPGLVVVGYAEEALLGGVYVVVEVGCDAVVAGNEYGVLTLED